MFLLFCIFCLWVTLTYAENFTAAEIALLKECSDYDDEQNLIYLKEECNGLEDIFNKFYADPKDLSNCSLCSLGYYCDKDASNCWHCNRLLGQTTSESVSRLDDRSDNIKKLAQYCTKPIYLRASNQLGTGDAHQSFNPGIDRTASVSPNIEKIESDKTWAAVLAVCVLLSAIVAIFALYCWYKKKRKPSVTSRTTLDVGREGNNNGNAEPFLADSPADLPLHAEAEKINENRHPATEEEGNNNGNAEPFLADSIADLPSRAEVHKCCHSPKKPLVETINEHRHPATEEGCMSALNKLTNLTNREMCEKLQLAISDSNIKVEHLVSEIKFQLTDNEIRTIGRGKYKSAQTVLFCESLLVHGRHKIWILYHHAEFVSKYYPLADNLRKVFQF